MYNKFMNEAQLNVKVGDRVNVHGYTGTVTKVIKGFSIEWNGTEYVGNPDKAYTNIQVHFDNVKEIGYQYQDGQYGDFAYLQEA